MKKKLPLTILITSLIFVLVVALLFLKLQRAPKTEFSVPAHFEVVESASGSPIRKQILQDNTGVLYEMRGVFTEELVKIEGRQDSAYEGNFVIENDPLKRKIKVVVLQSVFFGNYEGSFEKNSSWSRIDVERLNDELVLGEGILLQVNYDVGNVSQQDLPEYVVETQRVLDTIIKEFNNEDFTIAIPQDFFLVAQGVGVVR